MPHNRIQTDAGFTLAELVVATTLMSIVLLGIYTTFHSTILHWRNGSENESTYSDARRIFTILEHDLGGIPNDQDGVDARLFFSGDDSRMELISVIQPMNLAERAIQRPVRITYRLSEGHLIREERTVESPLLRDTGQIGGIDRERLKLGRKFESIIADRVLDFRLTYIWTPRVQWEKGVDPTWVTLAEYNATEYRLPDGMTVDLVLYDPAKDPGAPGTQFTKTFIFDGDSSRPPKLGVDEEEDLEAYGDEG